MVQQNYSVLMPPYSVSQYDSSALPNQQNLSTSTSNLRQSSANLAQANSSSNINNLFKQLIMPANMLPNQTNPLQQSHQHHRSQQQQAPIMYPNQNLYSQALTQPSNLIQPPVYPQTHLQQTSSSSTSSSSSFNNLSQYTTLSNVNFNNSNNISNSISNNSMGILSRNSNLLRGLNAQNGSYENLENFKSSCRFYFDLYLFKKNRLQLVVRRFPSFFLFYKI